MPSWGSSKNTGGAATGSVPDFNYSRAIQLKMTRKCTYNKAYAAPQPPSFSLMSNLLMVHPVESLVISKNGRGLRGGGLVQSGPSGRLVLVGEFQQRLLHLERDGGRSGTRTPDPFLVREGRPLIIAIAPLE
jgi:hypothetical protein